MSAQHHTHRWREMRQAQLRAEPLCRMCKAVGRLTAATVADHIVPHRGDDELFWEGELQSLCATCHSRHKQSQERGSDERGCTPDGIPLARLKGRGVENFRLEPVSAPWQSRANFRKTGTV